MSTLDHKTALVTGGSRGLGRQTALRLAEDGADVVLTYHTKAGEAAAVVAAIERGGRRAAALQADLTGTGEIPRLIEQFRATLREWGRERFEILVNNAGIVTFAPFPSVTEQMLDAQYSVNYKSVFFLTQGLLADLADGGRIINLGSGTAARVFGPLASYGPLKAAVEALSVYLAAQLGPRRITVNAVAPGALDTDVNAELFRQPGALDAIASRTALGRVGAPGDVAGVIAFLCGDDAAWITGARLDVSGGYGL